ncbi:uncharacterized protein PAC_10016 [Phialocephala subalpina]|uniref:Uncharacterized protein n=1 Tax=Phialocephala subalpina TaxID=576137 RepID=A0A1L7X522_9HELO|nr:uncharacterized protein PAC_10016 [Phialocephala subalpina]
MWTSSSRLPLTPLIGALRTRSPSPRLAIIATTLQYRSLSHHTPEMPYKKIKPRYFHQSFDLSRDLLNRLDIFRDQLSNFEPVDTEQDRRMNIRMLAEIRDDAAELLETIHRKGVPKGLWVWGLIFVITLPWQINIALLGFWWQTIWKEAEDMKNAREVEEAENQGRDQARV